MGRRTEVLALIKSSVPRTPLTSERVAYLFRRAMNYRLLVACSKTML